MDEGVLSRKGGARGVELTEVGAVVVRVAHAKHEENAVKCRCPITLLLLITVERRCVRFSLVSMRIRLDINICACELVQLRTSWHWRRRLLSLAHVWLT